MSEIFCRHPEEKNGAGAVAIYRMRLDHETPVANYYECPACGHITEVGKE